ncbi:MAG: adenine phosphoribosyltransferase [Candidatus Latescibacteria bacterium]|nr:adenine phosphoribosyltransferase [Candidatus Latescibacterota bacterium]OPX24435.1 MAG: adenine phosphoribosyltransferase [Candidatus Latescibacteria bacterium 4484_107]
MKLEAYIRDVPDFPKKGILFKDITPLLKAPEALREAVDGLCRQVEGSDVDVVVGIESRGFIFGAAVACQLGVGFVPVRKPGKLPAETAMEEYALEYGTDALEIHRDAISPGTKVFLVDDLLATGGTAAAACRLVEGLGGEVVHVAFLIELAFLKGREQLKGQEVSSILVY